MQREQKQTTKLHEDAIATIEDFQYVMSGWASVEVEYSLSLEHSVLHKDSN